MPTRTSTSLLNGLLDPRDDQAWQRFHFRYTPMLLSYAKRVGLSDADAQEVVSTTLATFVQKYAAGRYDRQKGRLKSWLGGIIHNKILKQRARRPMASLDAAQNDGRPRLPEPAAPDDTNEAFEREWQLDILNQALIILRRDIDPNTYQAFDLYAIKDWPVDKVATFLGMTPNAVYISKARTLKKLRKLTQRLIDEEDGPYRAMPEQ